MKKESECTCPCHEAPGMMHMFACCEPDDRADRKLEDVRRDWAEMRDERDAALAKLRIVSTPIEDVWMWENGGDNDPRSLACPVVMSADTLRDILGYGQVGTKPGSSAGDIEYVNGLREKLEEQRISWQHQVLVRADLERKLAAAEKILDAAHVFDFGTSVSNCRATREMNGTWCLQQCINGKYSPAIRQGLTREQAIEQAQRIASGED